MTSSEPHSHPGDTAKWYTRARRFPQLIGKTTDGRPLPGGPYTYTQVIAGVSVLVVGYKSMWLWGQFGWVTNSVLLIGVTIGLVFLLGKLPIGSRNPLNIAAGALHAFSCPHLGKVAGEPLRPRPPQTCRGKVVALETMPSLEDLRAATAERSRPSAAMLTRLRRPTGRRRQQAAMPDRPSTPRPLKLRPTPAVIRDGSHPTPALTGVQRTLAAAAQRHQEN